MKFSDTNILNLLLSNKSIVVPLYQEDDLKKYQFILYALNEMIEKAGY